MQRTLRVGNKVVYFLFTYFKMYSLFYFYLFLIICCAGRARIEIRVQFQFGQVNFNMSTIRC